MDVVQVGLGLGGGRTSLLFISHMSLRLASQPPQSLLSCLYSTAPSSLWLQRRSYHTLCGALSFLSSTNRSRSPHLTFDSQFENKLNRGRIREGARCPLRNTEIRMLELIVARSKGGRAPPSAIIVLIHGNFLQSFQKYIDLCLRQKQANFVEKRRGDTVSGQIDACPLDQEDVTSVS